MTTLRISPAVARMLGLDVARDAQHAIDTGTVKRRRPSIPQPNAADGLVWLLERTDGPPAINHPVREHRFATGLGRHWRADIAYPEQRLAVEVDGGSWVGGRHVSGTGFAEDCLKLNAAAALGWRVVRVTPAMIDSGEAVRAVRAALEWSPDAPPR